MSERLPDIRIMKAVCSTWPCGYCYSACNPYYSGHYRTMQAAAVAATKTKRALAQKRREYMRLVKG